MEAILFILALYGFQVFLSIMTSRRTATSNTADSRVEPMLDPELLDDDGFDDFHHADSDPRDYGVSPLMSEHSFSTGSMFGD